MRLLIALVITSLILAGANAQIWIMSPASQNSGNSGTHVTPTCANAMDFSQACNSQYIGAI